MNETSVHFTGKYKNNYMRVMGKYQCDAYKEEHTRLTDCTICKNENCKAKYDT